MMPTVVIEELRKIGLEMKNGEYGVRFVSSQH